MSGKVRPTFLELRVLKEELRSTTLWETKGKEHLAVLIGLQTVTTQ